MMIATRLLLLACAWGVNAGVKVVRTYKRPTGYEVTFSYHDPYATNVMMGGDVYYFTDQYHTTPQKAAGFDLNNWKPGDFVVGNLASNYGGAGKQHGYNMTRDANGTWWYRTPFPSGTYAYTFLPNCTFQPNCTKAYNFTYDPEHPPIQNYPHQQNASFFQVPYDPEFQRYGAFDLNFDFALPVDEEYRGQLFFVNYTAPGATKPATNLADYAVYLPKEYGKFPGKKYPVLYLLHGGGANGAAWPNNERVHHIIDRLILMNHSVPFVTIMPTYTSLGAGIATNTSAIRENFFKYLMPHVEANYNVSTNSSDRAVAGLSFGSVTTYEMYINATSYFTYYGLFSGALLPGAPQSLYVNASMVASNPNLATRAIMVTMGVFDIAFDDARQLQVALDQLSINYVSRLVPYAAHYYNNWQDAFWHFGQTVLWKPTPINASTGHGAVPFM